MAQKRKHANGEGSVFQRSDGRWQFTMRQGKDENGKRLRRSFYALSRADLVRRLADERAKSGGTIAPTNTKTVGAVVEAFLAAKNPERATEAQKASRSVVARSTFSAWSLAWKQVKPFVASYKLDAIGPKKVAEIRTALVKKAIGLRSIQIIWQLMRLAFDDAIRNEQYWRANPWRVQKAPTYEPKKPRALQGEEIPAFIAAAKHDRFEAVWLLGLLGGARLGEALGLTRDAIDFDKSEIYIRQQATEVNGLPMVERLKTASSVRAIYGSPVLMAALRRRVKAADREGYGSRFLFTTGTGGFPSRTNLRRRNFAKICTEAEIQGFTVHGLRHTWSVTTVDAAVPLSQAAQLGGWASTRMLADRYAQHRRERQQREAALAIQAPLTAGSVN